MILSTSSNASRAPSGGEARPGTVSVIIPVLNEASLIQASLESLYSELSVDDEVIVVDGGSEDETVALALGCGAKVAASERGRGVQMNTGAELARGDLLVFLHADTRLPPGFRSALLESLEDRRSSWGRFDLAFDSGGPLMRLTAWLISRRSRITGGATGDQAIFVRRALFRSLGGYAEKYLFEDVELCRRLRRHGEMAVPQGRVVTSARRWHNRGAWKTILLMWALKSAYLLGVPAGRLSRFYSDER